MKIIDSHLHIGKLSDTELVTPEQVRKQLSDWGVSGGLVLPFAMRGGGDDWESHCRLYHAAADIGFDLALYVNIEMLKESLDLSDYLLFPFKALKIHPDAIILSDQFIHHICEISIFFSKYHSEPPPVSPNRYAGGLSKSRGLIQAQKEHGYEKGSFRNQRRRSHQVL